MATDGRDSLAGDKPREESLDKMLARLRAACRNQPVPGAAIRRDRLDRLAGGLAKHRDALRDAIDRDFSCRSHRETAFAEIAAPLENIRYLRRQIANWMRPRRRRVGLKMWTTQASVVYQPLGVVGIMVPWNYPVYLTVEPLACALAAGNRAMIKLSEHAPESSRAIGAMLADVFEPDEVVAVSGGIDVAEKFARLPFDHLLFTGSTGVGRKVMRAAADGPTSLTLELGGKSPAILGPDADIELAANRISFGKTLNAGQTCLAPDYVYCQRNQLEPFMQAMRRRFSQMFPQLAGNPDYTAIINDQHYRRILALIDDAKNHGANVEALGTGDPPGSGRRLPLHLLTGVTGEMRVMQEEIFGPLLPILAYDDFREVIDFLDQRAAPLALYIFDRGRQRIRSVVQQTRSGGVCINDTVFHVAISDAPFGGVGESGFGTYHGPEGFDRFSHARTVFRRPRFNTAKLIYPGAGRAMRWLYRRLIP